MIFSVITTGPNHSIGSKIRGILDRTERLVNVKSKGASSI